jgi:hypothetical protein
MGDCKSLQGFAAWHYCSLLFFLTRLGFCTGFFVLAAKNHVPQQLKPSLKGKPFMQR